MIYWRVLKANLSNVFKRDIAYFGNNLASLLSTFFYTATQIAAIEFLFGNIDAIGQFSKNDIYFLALIGQLSFFIQVMTSFEGAVTLSEDVNNGAMDYTLLRPIPQRWHIYTKAIRPLTAVDAIPSIIPILIIIDWSQINIEPTNLLAGIAIFIMGYVIDHLLIYLLAMTSFWTGSAGFTVNYFWAERNYTGAPFNYLPQMFKVAIFVGLPAYISTALATSVMLGYTSAAVWVPIVFFAMIGWIIFSNFIWQRALRQYSSASS
jgi:ABC-type uncharacterized transport system permease subunit